MPLWTEDELKQQKILEAKLRASKPHSAEAISIGWELATLHGVRRRRLNPPNPVIDRAMLRLAKRLGIAGKGK